MILAHTIQRLSTLDHITLTALVKGMVKRKEKYTSAEFLGITNGREFCYNVTFKTEDGEGSTKVFVKDDPVTGKVFATAQ